MMTNKWPGRLIFSFLIECLNQRHDEAGVAAAVQPHVDDQILGLRFVEPLIHLCDEVGEALIGILGDGVEAEIDGLDVIEILERHRLIGVAAIERLGAFGVRGHERRPRRTAGMAHLPCERCRLDLCTRRSAAVTQLHGELDGGPVARADFLQDAGMQEPSRRAVEIAHFVIDGAIRPHFCRASAALSEPTLSTLAPGEFLVSLGRADDEEAVGERVQLQRQPRRRCLAFGEAA